MIREQYQRGLCHKPLKFEVACFAAVLAGRMFKMKVLIFSFSLVYCSIFLPQLVSSLPFHILKKTFVIISCFHFLSYPSSGQSEYSVILPSIESQNRTISHHSHHHQDIIIFCMEYADCLFGGFTVFIASIFYPSLYPCPSHVTL